MKWTLVSAFATGAVLASVMVYFAVRPSANVEEPQRMASVQPVTPVQERAPVQKVAPVAPAPPPPAPVAKHNRPTPPAPIREKPSPFHPRVLKEEPREEPVAVAKSVPPPRPVPTASPVAISPPLQNVSLPPPKPAPRVGPSVTLAAGTLLPVRIGQELTPARNQAGDSFLATLARPLVVDGWVIAERGARLEGHVEDKLDKPGIQNIRISIVRVSTSDGQNVRIHTEPYVRVPLAEIPVGAQITFKVLDPVTITERLE